MQLTVYCTMERTLRNIFEESIVRYAGNRLFSQMKGVEYTYSQFGHEAERLSSILDMCGVEKHDKVILFGVSHPNWPLAYMTVVTTARTVVPLLPEFTAYELANIVEHSESKDIIVSRKLYYKLTASVLESLRTVIILDDLDVVKSQVLGIVPEGGKKFEIPSDASNAYSRGDMIPDSSDIASIIYTSGTSGSSKGVMLTHANLVAQIAMLHGLFPLREDDVFLSILPLSHAYECSLGMLFPFTYGASVVYMNGAPTPSILMPALAQVRPTIMLSVPLVVEKIYKNRIRPLFTKNWFMQTVYSVGPVRRVLHRIAGKKLLEMFGGRLRFFGIGGSKLDSMVERFLKDAGFPYAIGYGLTETSPILAGAVPGKVAFQSTGPVVSGVQMRLDNMRPDGVGEIVVKGPNVMAGYYKDPERTATVLSEDGWFRTKDLGSLDAKGNLSIKGRVDNMIVGANGENIYPEEIESIINENAYVLESLVCQIKGRLVAKVHFNYERIESIHRFSESSVKGFSEKLEEIKQELMEYVNAKVNKFSKIVEIIDQQVPFEKTATQKIKRYLYV